MMLPSEISQLVLVLAGGGDRPQKQLQDSGLGRTSGKEKKREYYRIRRLE